MTDHPDGPVITDLFREKTGSQIRILALKLSTDCYPNQGPLTEDGDVNAWITEETQLKRENSAYPEPLRYEGLGEDFSSK